MTEIGAPDGDLSAREGRALSRLANREGSVVTTADVEDALDLHPKTARKMAASLCEDGHLARIAEGRYLVLPPDLRAGEVTGEDALFVGVSLIEPAYVGFWSALAYHGLAERRPQEVYVVTTRKEPNRTVLGTSYRLVPLIERKFFGFESLPVGDATVNVASVEKTLVDCADHPKHCGGIDELAMAMPKADRAGCDWETVVEHLRRVDNGAATKRIVYVADELGIDLPGREELVEGFTQGYSPLDPTRESAGRYDGEYCLLVNADVELYRPDPVS